VDAQFCMKALTRFMAIYIVPGAIFQSIAIAGGYGTGREIVQYFTQYGITGGVMGMLLSTVSMAVVLATTFELARYFQVYDYRSYMERLIGRGAVLYEILALTMLLIVLAVIGVAAGNILLQAFGLPVWAGTMLMFFLVMTLNFFGRELVTKVLTFWSVVLYAVFIAYFVVTLSRYGGEVGEQLALSEVRPGWAASALNFAMYNVAGIPMMLFAVRHIETRKQAIISGCLAALITMIPGVLFHLSYASVFPEILTQPLPTHWMIQTMSLQVLMVAYIIVLFGTFIETCSGSMQGVNERLDHWSMQLRGKGLSRLSHALTAGGAILTSGALSSVGIVVLVAQGYGTIAWGFLAVYVVPTLTIGVYQLVRNKNRRQ